MKGFTFFTFLFIGCIYSVFGNIGLPYRSPPVAGDLITEEEVVQTLRIEKELLILDVSKPFGEGAPCSAEYTVLNLEKQSIDISLSFLTPDASNVSIFINNEKVSSESREIPIKDIPWLTTDDFTRKPDKYMAEGFQVHFDPGEQKIITVLFSLGAGWHNRAAANGPTAPQAAHLFNMIKNDAHVSWYLYDLFSAATFGSTQFDLEVIIKIPKNADFLCNIPLEPHSSPEDDYNVFSGTFSEIPGKLIDFKVIYKNKYNFAGLTMGLGCGFPLDGRGIHFISRLYLDLFLFNHQISCGIDGDPWSGALYGVFQYTLFPPGSSYSTYDFIVDVRGGGGVLYDFLQDKGIGFRLFAGIKLFLPAYEVYYDFFPFTEDEELKHEIGVVCIIAL
ncbi:MAG: hypothetical protein JXJ04_23350 [Spirochaetales bacterium]|nr:hypothetical protein [Spirochaetales bacterium]